jgi:catechol 2,3-dioxygenase-like lactoylglutathione lyase family enzyme
MDSGTESDRAVKLEFSHVGLFVTDMTTMTDFYHRVLGFPITDRGYLG